MWGGITALSGVRVNGSGAVVRKALTGLIQEMGEGTQEFDVLINLLDMCCGREKTIRSAMPIMPRSSFSN